MDTHDHHAWQLKQDKNMAQRIIISKRLKSRFPDSVPVMIEYSNDSTLLLPNSQKSYKYVIHGNATMSQFILNFRDKYQLNPQQTLFVFLKGNRLVNLNMTFDRLYENYGDEDGFLYLLFASENVFG